MLWRVALTTCQGAIDPVGWQGCHRSFTLENYTLAYGISAMQESGFERNLGLLLGDVARLTRTAFDRRVQPLGLTRSHWWVLTYVFRDQGLTQSELANHLELGKVAMGKLIDRLEAKGWLERRPDPMDRRIRRIYLMAAAEPLLEAMREPSQDLYGMLVAGLSHADQERLVDMLVALRQNLLDDAAR